ncbi:DUF4355 domain-containing protein [Enterococcus sp. DIV0800]|uniref:DUF4355 domain-containing protein n=1 Tax=unclassified Enterococcus TaxID=2608891 RepID=UPI003D2FFB1D
MINKQVMPMHLQFFAEPGGDDTPPAGDQTPEFDAGNLTDEQLAAIKDQFGFKDDNDVNLIVKSKHSKWQKELEQEKNKAAELAKLSEKERQQALLDLEKEKFEKEKAKFREEQLFVEKGKQLTAEGMPAEFANRVNGDTAEDILADVKALREEWDAAIEAEVNKRLVQKQPRVGTNGGGTVTKKSIMAVKDDDERTRLISENRNLF